jgi:hypothetical protein
MRGGEQYKEHFVWLTMSLVEALSFKEIVECHVEMHHILSNPRLKSGNDSYCRG